jgi:Galactose oxidase, central domain
VVNGPGPSGRYYHTVTSVGSKLFVFGGKIGKTALNDMWALDLNTRTLAHYSSEPFSSDCCAVKSQPFWESYEPTSGNEKPLPRASHVSVTTEDRIIMSVPLISSLSPLVIILRRFGGSDSRHDYNDTWSFDISTRKWTELQCTGSIPSPRSGHAAVLIDDVMYVFGGFTMDKTYLDDLFALQLSSE